MKNVAIIPARGGSKRIPGKNIKSFMGKPIISYSIELALKSNLFDEVMVSTDDEEICTISKKNGATIPFIRSNENANDYATINDVINEVIISYENSNKHFDNFCCIFSTAPLISLKKFREAYELLLTSNFDSVFTVVKYSSPIQRALKFENNKMKMMHPENLNIRSQDLEPAFYDAGQFFWMKTKEYINKKCLWTDNCTAIELSAMECQDIDTVEDWKIAEIKYRLINERMDSNVY